MKSHDEHDGVQVHDDDGPGRFEAFFRTHQPRMVRFVRAQVRNADDAEDVVQEVMYNLHRVWTRYDRPDLLAWRMAKQEVAKLYRSQARIPHQTGAPQQDAVVDERAGDEIAAVESTNRVLALVSHLPAQQREVFCLRELAGLANHEVCDVLGMTASAVSTQHQRAKARLQALYRQHFGDDISTGIQRPVEGAMR